MKIGNARYCISPKKEFYLIGYRSDNRNYPASGIHDDIYANSLLFEQNGKRVFIFSADVLEFEEEMAEDVKTIICSKFNIDRDCILLSATHNHSSIVSYHKSWYTGKFDQEYHDFFVGIIVKSFQTCLDNLRDATGKYGKKIITGYYGNRNHPGELADNEAILVEFSDLQGNVFAGLVNWAVHSTVISAENTYLTSELAGEVSKKLGNELGYVPLMMVGAAGDCSNRNERQGNDFEELERVSGCLAKEIGSITADNDIELGTISCQTLFHTIHHNMEFVHQEISAEIEKMKEAATDGPDKSLEKRIKNLEKELEVKKFHLDAKGEVINIGKMQLFVFPGELGSAFGIKMKKECSGLGIVCGYTNGYYEYFMPASEYGLSFETIGCRVPRGEPEKMVEKFIQASKLLNGEK